MSRRVYYTWYEIVIAWFKKRLGIKSPSAMLITQGRYEYEYDFIMKVEHPPKVANTGVIQKTKVYRERKDYE